MRQSKYVILLSGKMGSGKSTLQNNLKRWLSVRGDKVDILNFADVLYQIHDSCINIINRYIEPRNIVKDGPLLQLLGTEWGRKTISEDIWVKCLQKKVEQSSARYIIVGDCRFQNEFNAFPNALRVRLLCNREERKRRCSMWRDNEAHPSEIDLDGYSDSEKFDLYLHTDIDGAEQLVHLVVAQLQKNSWIEKRKK